MMATVRGPTAAADEAGAIGFELHLPIGDHALGCEDGTIIRTARPPPCDQRVAPGIECGFDEQLRECGVRGIRTKRLASVPIPAP